VKKEAGKKIIVGGGILVLALIFLFSSKFFRKTFDSHQFLTQLKEQIIEENWLESEDDRKLVLKKEQGKFSGFDWINQEGQVELVSGYFLEYNPFGNSFTRPDPNIAGGAEKIKNYLLAKGFKVNDDNTYFDQNEQSFWAKENALGGRLGLEKGEIKCLLSPYFLAFINGGLTLNCGDLSQSTTPAIYQEIYAFANPQNDLKFKLTIDNYTDEFAVGGTGGGGGGAASLWKKENGQWRTLQTTQMAWDCQILLDNQVPASLINQCLFYDQPAYEEQNYPDLYQQTLGQ
jgi:hypothetical protein